MDEQQEQDYKELKSEIADIRDKFKSAKKVLDNITALSVRVEQTRMAFEVGDGSTQGHIKAIETKAKELEYLRATAQSDVGKVEESLVRINMQVKELETAYANFSEIKGKIESRESEVTTLLKSAQGLQADIETTKTNAQNTLGNINKTFEDIQSKVTEMQTAYENFLQIRAQIEDKDTGLTAALQLIKETQKTASALINGIKAFHTEISTILDDVKKKQKDTTDLQTKISQTYKFSQEKKNQIQEATDLIIDASFSENFERRRKNIEDKLHSWKPWLSWKLIFFLSILSLGYAVLYLATHTLDGLTGIDLAVTRLFYTSPLIILVAFSATQYSKERDLAEKYAFKAAASSAIRNHIEFLITKFGREDEQVIQFVVSTFKTIYKEPYKSDEMRRRMHKMERKIDSLEQERRYDPATLSDITASLRDLKELIPDENVFKQVIGFTSKLIGKN